MTWKDNICEFTTTAATEKKKEGTQESGRMMVAPSSSPIKRWTLENKLLEKIHGGRPGPTPRCTEVLPMVEKRSANVAREEGDERKREWIFWSFSKKEKNLLKNPNFFREITKLQEIDKFGPSINKLLSVS